MKNEAELRNDYDRHLNYIKNKYRKTTMITNFIKKFDKFDDNDKQYILSIIGSRVNIQEEKD